MGHVTAKAYRDLQKRLDRNPIGAPANRALFGILEELFTPEECRVAAALPLKFATAERIGRTIGMSHRQLQPILRVLCEKGLLVDIERKDGRIYYYLNPPMIGFFEYSMMRVRDDIDQTRLARLMWEYLFEDPELGFMRMAADGDTFIARPLVHEDALEPELYSEVLDYEKASELIANAGSWAEGICHCRHMKLHLGKPCDYPMEHCLTLGFGAEYLIRNGLSKRISKERAVEVLEYAREHGNVQMADNVKKRCNFICNCCKCCCEMMEAIRRLPEESRVLTSNYVALSDPINCNGCGKCAKACPIDCIDLVPAGPTEALPRRKKRAVINTDLCLGCGVCHRTCSFDALHLEFIGVRVHTPESTMEKVMLQSIERGKVQDMLFDDPSRVTHRTLGTFLGVLLKLPPAKQLLAQEQLRSRFVDALLTGMSLTGDGWLKKTFGSGPRR